MSVERFSRKKNGLEIIGPIKEEKYRIPTEIIFGRNSLLEITKKKILANAKKGILVTGEHFKRSKEFTLLRDCLEGDGRDLVVYGVRITISNAEAVNNLTSFVRESQPDLIFAVGGGSILDSGKCAAILASNLGRVEKYLLGEKKIEAKGINFIAVPTTAGTGSEVTPWATVWDTLSKEKYSLASSLMFPSLAIVDPSLTDSLPSRITAETGMDALSQAIEAYWSRSHNLVSDEYALQAIKLAMESLKTAVNHPNYEIRDRMSRASLYAGLAFSNTRTTICHSVSYPITAHFGIAHGQAVAITLPSFIKYSLLVLKERERPLLDALGVETASEAAEKVENLMRDVGLATRLSELGIKEKDLGLIVEKGFHPNRANNAPRIPTKKELGKILQSII